MGAISIVANPNAQHRFADKAAFELHLQAAVVKHISEWGAENNVIDMAAEIAPASHVLAYIPGLCFERLACLSPEAPAYLRLTHVEAAPGTSEVVVAQLKAAVEATRDKNPSALLCGVLKDVQADSELFVLEAYDMPQNSTGAIQSVIEQAKELLTSFKVHEMRKAGGFWTSAGQ